MRWRATGGELRAFLPLVVLLAACGSDQPAAPGAGFTTVEFAYLAATATDPAVAQAFPDCVNGVGALHIHPSWRNFVRINMTVAGLERWEITFDDVPTDVLVRIRISDPNTCADNPTGASTENVFANGIRLTMIVDTPGSGVEPGLGFTVDGEGRVTP